MKSKLFAVPFIALMAIGTVVNAQDNKKSESQVKDQAIDQYQTQKKTGQTAFKRDMDALNDQKNLTPAQKEVRRKQIIATYQQQKKANQEAFEQNKEAQKTVTKKEKEVEKKEDMKEHKMKEKHEDMAKKHLDNRANTHRANKPPVAHEPHH
ncbi:MAG: hypothetical protein H7068_00100 [Pedobacter sp.]|nr:hypothetical protein [Chitinophagaceae bacterium]